MEEPPDATLPIPLPTLDLPNPHKQKQKFSLRVEAPSLSMNPQVPSTGELLNEPITHYSCPHLQEEHCIDAHQNGQELQLTCSDVLCQIMSGGSHNFVINCLLDLVPCN